MNEAKLHSPVAAFPVAASPFLFRHPTVSQTSIVFKFANDLWEAPRAGGDAIRLTNAPGIVGDPFFSPDGRWIAFSANYDGHSNVYVMPDRGGAPKRLTAHPSPEQVVGWTPDGKYVTFTSSMLSNTDQPRLFKASIDGGFPIPLPLPSGTEASYSPDGSHLAYVPLFHWETAWKRYRGGQAYKIWIADLADSKVKEIPRKTWNDSEPVWMGSKVYYLSDRKGPVGLYSFDVGSGQEKVEVPGDGFDMKSLTGGAGILAYEKLGSIHLFDPATHSEHEVSIKVSGDFPEARPSFKDLRPYLDSASISPSGNRVAIATRGFIYTVPASKGDVHATDLAQGVHRRDVAWSPDGKSIAYITDEAGYRQLALWDSTSAKIRRLDVGVGASLYAGPQWSPDSSKIYCSDYRGLGWLIDVKSGKSIKALQWQMVGGASNPTWSPDSKWLAYTESLPSHFNVVSLYSLETGKSTQLTDGLADAHQPVFDRDGKYLYFYASTRVGQGATLGDLSQFNNLNQVASLYAVMLKKGMPNPLQPESDEEAAAVAAAATSPAPGVPPVGQTPPAKPPAPPAPTSSIDLDGIESRIIALPTPPEIYQTLEPATPGSFFALYRGPATGPESLNPFLTASKFSWTGRTFTPAFGGVLNIQTTPDGSKALLSRPGQLAIVSTAGPAGPETGVVNLSGITGKIDPKAEWTHIFHEIWREAPLHFYSPTTNGIDPKQMEARYEPFLENICSRDDLNHLIDDMLGELCVGHEFPGGGDRPGGKALSGGLLGADYSFENGHYKITRIYDGEHWNPELYAPLAQPGTNAKVGEYVLAIDGQDLTSSLDIYLALENKAGKQVKVKLGPTADGKGSREVVVVPVVNEFELRNAAWAEDNRRLVSQATGGRAGYVHVPDTNVGGWIAFNRYYYAQIGRDGIVVDERFNHGGLFNDYMIHEMQKSLFAYFAPRYGVDEPTPAAAIFGPKVLMINEFAGSGGDMFPWLFRQAKIGPLIGKRTWGGLVAVQPLRLADNGVYTAPDFAFYDPRAGKWDVENWGVSPDIDVELDPAEWRKGIDSQLQKAISEINKMLASYKPIEHRRPAYPDRTKLDVRY